MTATFGQVTLLIFAGLFILTVITALLWIIRRFYKKRIKPMLINMSLKRRRDKLLSDEKVLEYAMNRVQREMDGVDVRKELILANRYKPFRIEEIVYVFKIVKEEMTGISEKGVKDNGSRERKRRTQGTFAEDLPE